MIEGTGNRYGIPGVHRQRAKMPLAKVKSKKSERKIPKKMKRKEDKANSRRQTENGSEVKDADEAGEESGVWVVCGGGG